MDYLNFSFQMCIAETRQVKSDLIFFRILYYLTIMIALSDAFILYHDPSSWMVAITIGVMIANALYASTQIQSLKIDLKLNKERLLHLENMRDDENRQDMIKQLRSTKQYYEDYIRYQKTQEKTPIAPYPENKPPKSTSPTVEN